MQNGLFTGEIIYIPVENLYHHPDNPRKDLGDLSELAESIKAKGILQNLTVVPGHKQTHEEWTALSEQYHDHPSEELRTRMNAKWIDIGYTVIIGHRRLEAGKLAGLQAVPCVITEMSYEEQIQTMAMENMQRSDLTAFEQAQCFQMMIDFGASVEAVAEKTGFSKSTIRRRLEWAKLDGDTMKEVSSRQISFTDLDKLSQINDLGTRNKVLCEIGTNNFENKLLQAVKAQEDAAREKMWRETLVGKGAIEVPYKELMGNKYNYCAPGYAYMASIEDIEKFLTCLDDETQYYFAFSYGSVYFRREKTESEKDDERPEKEDQQETERKAKHDALTEAFSRAYRLRIQFVNRLSDTAVKKKINTVIEAIIESEWDTVYIRTEDVAFADMLGVTIPSGTKNYEFIKEAAEANLYRALLAYALFKTGESEDITCFSYNCRYYANKRLNRIYELLEKIGYEMSDEEKELMDGTSELYVQDPEPEEAADDYDDYDPEYEEYDDEEDAIAAALEEEGAEDDE